jgi:hypothetical protein
MATKDHGAYSLGGGKAVAYDETQGEEQDILDVETDDDAEKRGSTEHWQHWQLEIQASLKAEKRFREEGKSAEAAYFGNPDHSYTEASYQKEEHKVNTIHANIEVLKPLVFSEKPDPIVRRRFGGDGENDPTDRVAALVAQRLCEFFIDTAGFESAVESARDDWLIPGRGQVRVLYGAKFEDQPVINPATQQPYIDSETGKPFTQRVKSKEEIRIRHWPWPRVLFSASNTWDDVRWIAFETPMTKKQVKDRFDEVSRDRSDTEVEGQLVSEAMTYPMNGFRGAEERSHEDDMRGYDPDTDEETSKTTSTSANDQCIVYEIWDKQDLKVIWWSPHYRADILDTISDPLKIEGFFNCPKPLLSVTKNGSLTPRSDIAFYRARADEIDKATQKLSTILETISVSGVYPGKENSEVMSLLNGKKNKLVAIEDWMAFIERGGMDGMIQWLPIDIMVKVAQALISMRDQSKMALYEISGISDIVRGQSDPNETLGAQQIKGNYANLRLRDKQRKVAKFALEIIKIALEICVEHFDVETIKKIVNLDLPATDAQLQQLNERVAMLEQQHAAAVQMAQEAGQQPPEKPKVPFYEQTSWERVQATLKDDMARKFTLSIETDGTILSDQDEDKKQRVEFLQAFTQMAESLLPLAMNGTVEMKLIKELLLFAVRGFPKSRTLEGMLSALPDDFNTEPQEDPAVTVANIRAQVDKMLKEMEIAAEQAEQQKDHQHELRVKGLEILADGMIRELEPPSVPPT